MTLPLDSVSLPPIEGEATALTPSGPVPLGHYPARFDGPAAVLAIITQAVERGIPAETMESLQRMYHAEQDRAAALGFALALAAFQDECEAIPRTSTAEIATRAGGAFTFKYADFEQIVATVRPHLRRLGFSFTFDVPTPTAPNMLTCVCSLRHVNGHHIASGVTVPTESSSPSMNAQQRVGAALTFAKRQTLISVLGLSLTDPSPDDGAGAEPITEEQAATLDALLDEVKADRPRFFHHFGIKALSDLRQSQRLEAVGMIERKRNARR